MNAVLKNYKEIHNLFEGEMMMKASSVIGSNIKQASNNITNNRQTKFILLRSSKSIEEVFNNNCNKKTRTESQKKLKLQQQQQQ